VTATEPGVLLAGGSIVAVAALATWLVRRDCRSRGQTLAEYAAFRLLWIYCKLWHGVRPRGRDPLPPSGPVILVSNHTSTSDPMFLQCGTHRIISFIMAREFYSIRFLRPIFNLNKTILVSRRGHDMTAIRAALRALREGRVVGIFPEGGIHLDRNSLGEFKPGTALLALWSQAPVIPVCIDRERHTNRLFDGIVRPAHARVYFGREIDLTKYHGRQHDAAVLDEVTKILAGAIDELRRRGGNR
jgi:1-acyl-sn-glycerol-3-phosphate acyltransferase